MENLKDLFRNHLKDIYSAERQLTEALPKMEEAALHPDLKKGFSDHLTETQNQMFKLKDIMNNMGVSPSNNKCKAMEGLIEEGEEIIKKEAPSSVKDAALIAAAQRVEHYEIAAYGTVVEYAKTLGLDAEAEVLKEILDEESACNEKLNTLAIDKINQSAV